VATNVCLDAIARDQRRSVLAAKSVENGAPPSTTTLRGSIEAVNACACTPSRTGTRR
jgi:hypothetical protein